MLLGTIDKNDRRVERSAVRVPVTVQVSAGRTGMWKETVESRDLSSAGAAIVLSRPVTVGRIVLLSLRMPVEFRLFGHDSPNYEVWGVVRRCIRVDTENSGPGFATGIAFVGKDAPAGYSEHPSRLYDMGWHGGRGGFWHVTEKEAAGAGEKRRETRFPIPEALLIQLLDEDHNAVSEEPTVTENISAGGAVVFTNFYAAAGTFLKVISERHGLELISVVRSHREGPDGLSRLHVEFIDRLFPLEGVV